MKKIYDNKILIIIISCIVLLVVFLFSFINYKDRNIDKISLNTITKTDEVTTKISELFYVDVKGNVKNPGVYKFEENERVKDAIEKAGGLTKNANTDNINLSQKLFNEMVIYVYSNNEIKNGNNKLDCSTICETKVIEVNNCINTNKKDLININTASLEELQTLTGIGESKAKAIIEYRNKNKFEKIEDILNVSGIGNNLYEEIKIYITT